MPAQSRVFSTCASKAVWAALSPIIAELASPPTAIFSSGSRADRPTPSAIPDSSSASSINSVCSR